MQFSRFVFYMKPFAHNWAQGGHVMKMGKNGEKGEKRVKKSRF